MRQNGDAAILQSGSQRYIATKAELRCFANDADADAVSTAELRICRILLAVSTAEGFLAFKLLP